MTHPHMSIDFNRFPITKCKDRPKQALTNMDEHGPEAPKPADTVLVPVQYCCRPPKIQVLSRNSQPMCAVTCCDQLFSSRLDKKKRHPKIYSNMVLWVKSHSKIAGMFMMFILFRFPEMMARVLTHKRRTFSLPDSISRRRSSSPFCPQVALTLGPLARSHLNPGKVHA